MSRRKRRRPRPPRASSPAAPARSAAAARPSRARFAFIAALVVLAAAAGTWWALRPRAPSQAIMPIAQTAVEAHFVGSEACAGCHANAFAAWKGSQHAHAMQHATAETVLGNFADARFQYAGIESTFFRRAGKYFVHTDGADGKLA